MFRMNGDPFNHPVPPWIVDFTSVDGINDIGWRDSNKSKCRLTKGDHQIDHAFLFSPQPYHIIPYCNYIKSRICNLESIITRNN